jgi:multiple sugar transport system permease protein
LVFSIYEYGFIRFDFGRASAVAIILLVITVTLALIQFRFLRTNVEY